MYTLYEHQTVDNHDELIAGIQPALLTGAKVIRKLGTAATLKRGTVLAKDSADGKLVILGTDQTEGTYSGTGDGSTTVFDLTDDGVKPSGIKEVKVDGTAVTTGWVYNAATGELKFSTAPANTKAVAVKTLFGEMTADAILCRDTLVGTAEDVTAVCYLTGMFNKRALVVAEGYTLTDGDEDDLRAKGIYLKTPQESI